MREKRVEEVEAGYPSGLWKYMLVPSSGIDESNHACSDRRKSEQCRWHHICVRLE